MLKSGVNYKRDNVLIKGSRSMELSSSCPLGSCPGDKPLENVDLRFFFLVKMGKSLLILINISFINWITGRAFHKLKILEVYDLQNCVLQHSEKFDNIWFKPNGDIIFEILVIRLFGRFEKWGFKFYLGFRKPKLALWKGGLGGRDRFEEV